MWFSSRRRCFGLYFLNSSLSWFLVSFLRNCRKYHAFRLWFLLIFRVSCDVYVWKASKTQGFCMVDVSKVMQQEAANRQRLRSNRRHKPHSHGRHHPQPHPPTLHRAERQHVQKVESRQKHRKNRCELRHIGNNKRNRRHKPHSHGHHPPPHPPPNPRIELKDKCKSKPACAESRESAKIL